MFQTTEEKTGFYDIRSLEIFWLVVKTGKLTFAANCLHISQPAVSAAISKMEKKLGHDLIVRGGQRKITLTEPGKRLYIYAEDFFRCSQEKMLSRGSFLPSKATSINLGVSSLFPTDAVQQIFQTQVSLKKSNTDLIIESEDVIELTRKFNDKTHDLVITPKLTTGITLALSHEPHDIKVATPIYTARLKGSETNAEGRLVMLKENFFLQGLLPPQQIRPPAIVHSHFELAQALLNDGAYTIITDSQLKHLEQFDFELHIENMGERLNFGISFNTKEKIASAIAGLLCTEFSRLLIN